MHKFNHKEFLKRGRRRRRDERKKEEMKHQRQRMSRENTANNKIKMRNRKDESNGVKKLTFSALSQRARESE